MAESALRQLVPQSAEPFVRSYNPFNPAFRETMRASISDLLGGRAMGGTPTQRYRANIADMLTGAVEMAPGVGEAVGVTDTRQAIRSGDYGTAAMLGGATALGMVPVIGDAASRAIRVFKTGQDRFEIDDQSNPGIVLTLGKDEDEEYMRPVLELKYGHDLNEVGGKGTATRLYLEALARTSGLGLGWASDSILSDSSWRMYERLKSLGIPFTEHSSGPKFVISPDELSKVDIRKIQQNFNNRSYK